MNKFLKLFPLVLALCLMLSACGDSGILKELPGDAKNFITTEYSDPGTPGDTSYAGCIEHNGRLYVLYGAQGASVRESSLEECIGYVDGDTANRVFTLKATDDFICTYNINGVMEQFYFLRALDTKGRDIDIPRYINEFYYDIWLD